MRKRTPKRRSVLFRFEPLTSILSKPTEAEIVNRDIEVRLFEENLKKTMHYKKLLSTQQRLREFGIEACPVCNKLHDADFIVTCQDHNKYFEPSDGFTD